MLLSDAIYLYITPREAAESDIPFHLLVASVNTNAAVYNPAVAIIPSGINIARGCGLTGANLIGSSS